MTVRSIVSNLVMTLSTAAIISVSFGGAAGCALVVGPVRPIVDGLLLLDSLTRRNAS